MRSEMLGRLSRVGAALGALFGMAFAPPHIDGGAGASSNRPGRALVRRSVPLREACRLAGTTFPPGSLRLHVYKRERRLAVYSGSRLLKELPIGLGGMPEGDKRRQGDRRTPEGTFYVCTRLAQCRFHRFAGLSYPATDDARRGREAGQISAAQAREIEAAMRMHRQPPWDTALGGAVGIHGGGAGADWTLGCIALDNPDIEALFPLLALGTPITIEP